MRRITNPIKNHCMLEYMAICNNVPFIGIYALCTLINQENGTTKGENAQSIQYI